MLTLALALSPQPLVAESGCPEGSDEFFITGYLRWSPPMAPTTADGTPIWTPEAIVAASYELELGQHVRIAGLPPHLGLPERFRVADRFGDPSHVRRLDIAVWDLGTALELTGAYCVSAEEGYDP